MNSKPEWWQTAVFYQIYPRSFADGNGDGMGDFAGMIEKLDYLQSLGVDAVWLSPHYPSPFIDCGYDISDYENVAPEYGDLKEFKQFLDGLHQRGMHLILDLVLNHTSDKHPWFLESKSSRDNPKRDWYIWKKGDGAEPPNNWFSTFGGSAWELDQTTDEYYYHFFFKEQPDLNWNNPEVKKAMFDVVRFWLNMGVDGFRLDAVGTIFEDEHYFNHPESMTMTDLIRLELSIKNFEEQANVTNLWDRIFQFQHDMPEVHDLMKELRKVVDEYDHRVLVGETDDISFYGNGSDELHLVFNFPLMRVPRITANHVRNNQRDRLSHLPAGVWPCNTLGNHDSSRMYNHFGNGKDNSAIARQNLMMLLTLKGTPFLYNGEEIGMSDYLLQEKSQFRDTLSLEYVKIIKEIQKLNDKEAIYIGAERGRDKCRTPLQWSAAENAGFCPQGVTPWLPVNPDYQQGVNVQDEINRTNSLWHFYQKMLELRHQSTALQTGDYQELPELSGDLFGFIRFNKAEKVIVLLNFGEHLQRLDRKNLGISRLQILMEGQTNQIKITDNEIEIKPYGCVILKVG